MQPILAVTVPFFALVLLGWLGARLGPLPDSAIPGLNAYVLFFALPCMLFRFGSSLPIGELVDPALVGVYFAAAVVMVGATLALTLRRRGAAPRDGVDLRDGALGALVAAFPNAGFMGVPLLVALFGPAAAGPVIGVILVDLIFTTTLCVALARAGETARGDGRRHEPAWWRAGLAALRGALANPMPWAIVAGAAFGASRRALPAPVEQVVRMLGETASPVALFTIGAVLCRGGRHAHTRTPIGRFLPVALLKNLAHPALVLGLGLAAGALGAPVPRFGLMVLVLTAALPSASNVAILAERYGADNGRIARIIMASTALAFATFTGVAALYGVAERS